MAGRCAGVERVASEHQQLATAGADGSRKNHDNPGTHNTPRRPSKSSTRLVAVGLTSRRDMPDDDVVRRVSLVGLAGNSGCFRANLALPFAWKGSEDSSQDVGKEF